MYHSTIEKDPSVAAMTGQFNGRGAQTGEVATTRLDALLNATPETEPKRPARKSRAGAGQIREVQANPGAQLAYDDGQYALVVATNERNSFEVLLAPGERHLIDTLTAPNGATNTVRGYWRRRSNGKPMPDRHYVWTLVAVSEGNADPRMTE